MKQRTLKTIERFEKCSVMSIGERTKVGLRQFLEKEGKGITPQNPDRYFLVLESGKAFWELTCNMYAESYNSLNGRDWPGWAYLKEQFKNDPHGYEQIRARVKPEAKKLFKRLKTKEKMFENFWREND